MTSVQGPLIAWQNGSFIPEADLRISVNDIGFRQSVIAVERLRTYHGRVAALDAHIVRWRRTLEELYLNIQVDVDELRERMERLLERNRDWLNVVGDCGIVLLATPGLSGGVAGVNELCHLISLDLQKIAQHRQSGQPVFITDVEQPSAKCWPRDIKVRCRLHYYLADTQAREHHPAAIGVLTDHDGTITETSVANIAVVRGGRVIAPPKDQVLPGITQQQVERCCEALSIPWTYERLWPAQVREADELWLMGTDGGLWFANRIDGAAISDGKPGEYFAQALAAFDSQLLGMPKPVL